MFGLKFISSSFSVCKSSNVFRQLSTKAPKKSAYVNSDTTVVMAKKKDIKQSPLKMKFLVDLIRGRWVPDALAQLKFSPKHRAVDVAKVVNRACVVSRIHHECIPEELYIKEVMITKGFAQKKNRIMGRGRTGVGYKRASHLTLKVDKLDFEKLIADAKTVGEKRKWANRNAEVKKLKNPEAVNLSPITV